MRVKQPLSTGGRDHQSIFIPQICLLTSGLHQRITPAVPSDSHVGNITAHLFRPSVCLCNRIALLIENERMMMPLFLCAAMRKGRTL